MWEGVFAPDVTHWDTSESRQTVRTGEGSLGYELGWTTKMPGRGRAFLLAIPPVVRGSR